MYCALGLVLIKIDTYIKTVATVRQFVYVLE